MAGRAMRAGGPQRGETEDMEALMAEHEAGLLRYATRILNDPVAAQDVVQDAFIKFFRHRSSGRRHTGKISSWLYRVTHNNAVDYIRRESRLRDLHHRGADEKELLRGSDGGIEKSSDERISLVLEHMRVLKPHEQQVLILRLQEGKSYREISDITKRSEGNVGCILHHAVRKISHSLKQAGVV